jgi:hypothetical protein
LVDRPTTINVRKEEEIKEIKGTKEELAAWRLVEEVKERCFGSLLSNRPSRILFSWHSFRLSGGFL